MAEKDWDAAIEITALEAVRQKEMETSKMFKAPRSTLENYINRKTIKDAKICFSTQLTCHYLTASNSTYGVNHLEC